MKIVVEFLSMMATNCLIMIIVFRQTERGVICYQRWDFLPLDLRHNQCCININNRFCKKHHKSIMVTTSMMTAPPSFFLEMNRSLNPLLLLLLIISHQMIILFSSLLHLHPVWVKQHRTLLERRLIYQHHQG